MPQTTIDHLIINSPYEELRYHRRRDREMRRFDLAEGCWAALSLPLWKEQEQDRQQASRNG